ncbi:MAG TPA: ABC transporter permease [Bacteroidia bacterium]|nr:ABC transporter permease [Bacteroidia bacterium]
MSPLAASIIKEFKVLSRDKTGLFLMFLMPLALALLMTVLQNSAFKIVNENKVDLMLVNNDSNSLFFQNFRRGLEQTGMFNLSIHAGNNTDSKFSEDKASIVLVTIPKGYAFVLNQEIESKAEQALQLFGMLDSVSVSEREKLALNNLELSFDPVLQESYRYSIKSTVISVVMAIQNEMLLRQLFYNVNQFQPDSTALAKILPNPLLLSESLLKENSVVNPNATQHNIPAWTVFAMFFTVISLGGNIVREKRSGSFLRIKTLPVSITHLLIAKQVVFLVVTVLQTFVLFSIGAFLFPILQLPPLIISSGFLLLFLATFSCGLCAVSYALCIGVYSNTIEQANGFGAASVVILAAVGGIFVPLFAMPEVFKLFAIISPFSWAMKAYYKAILEISSVHKLLLNVLPLLLLTAILQLIAFIGLKRKNLL